MPPSCAWPSWSPPSLGKSLPRRASRAETVLKFSAEFTWRARPMGKSQPSDYWEERRLAVNREGQKSSCLLLGSREKRQKFAPLPRLRFHLLKEFKVVVGKLQGANGTPSHGGLIRAPSSSGAGRDRHSKSQGSIAGAKAAPNGLAGRRLVLFSSRGLILSLG